MAKGIPCAKYADTFSGHSAMWMRAVLRGRWAYRQRRTCMALRHSTEFAAYGRGLPVARGGLSARVLQQCEELLFAVHV